MAKTYCPECSVTISMDNPREGAMIVCPECRTELEIISNEPFEVDYPLDDEWEEEWEEEE
ncbi:MAG: lysine biosynthesis protein LysW [Chloroflexota bacterium]|nr:lysine biosynthesis protein LysW [Chloroflexota bacterium]